MFDLMAVAFQADITRVFTFMLGRELSSRTYPQLGISEPHHAVSHHQNKPERIEKYATTNAYHAQLVGEVPRQAEGDPRRQRHAARPLAAAVGLGHEQPEHPQLRPAAGGAARRRLRPPEGRPPHRGAKEGTPMANLLLSLAHSGGVEQERFGDSTGTRQLCRAEGRAMSHTAVVARAVAVLLVVSAPAVGAQKPAPGGTARPVRWRERRRRGRRHGAAPGRRGRRRHGRRAADPRRRGRQRHDAISRHAAVDCGAARQRRHRPRAAEGRGRSRTRVMGEGEPVHHDRGADRECRRW